MIVAIGSPSTVVWMRATSTVRPARTSVKAHSRMVASNVVPNPRASAPQNVRMDRVTTSIGVEGPAHGGSHALAVGETGIIEEDGEAVGIVGPLLELVAIGETMRSGIDAEGTGAGEQAARRHRNRAAAVARINRLTNPPARLFRISGGS